MLVLLRYIYIAFCQCVSPKLLGSGKSNQEIAAVLHLTEGTVKNHLTNIFCQLGLRDRTQAALWAYRNLLSF
ncbi:LuxR C-terminal-related transcriptional regulator [Brasilonema sp. UFV-L1]|uniref:LuxR C-terminal-related transcriptional regulator n=1 Tax=Brasilonema sp. UFV-L1 TaxID=2234130 RepID=UPI001B7D2056